MQKSYGERLLDQIVTQCESRGIDVDDVEDFLAQVAEDFGVDDFLKLHGGQLRDVQRHLDAHFRKFLGGHKRVPGTAPTAWPETATSGAVVAAAKAGLDLSSIEGTGKDGAVTKDDVAKAAAAAAE